MTAPADARRCPICRQPECDKHSLHQQLGRHAVVTGPNVTSVGNATDSSLGPIVPGHKGPFTLAIDPASPQGDHSVRVMLQHGMDGTMEVLDVTELDQPPRRVPGKLTIRG